MIHLPNHARMHPSTILTVDYHDPPATPWPRLLRFIAILSMLYGAAFVGEAVSSAMMIWPLRRTPSISGTPGQYWLWSIGCAVQVAIAATLIWGGAKLLQGASHRLMLIGFWTLISLWPISTVLGLILQPAMGYFNLLLLSLTYSAERNLFPLAAIVLLRAYRSR